jgi:ABC-type microcin C transport system permease subunit YejB
MLAKGSCYALGQEDGCVHHLMLVLERGLKALAAKLGVPYQHTNCQDIINKIASEFKSMPRGLDRDFYTEVNAQFGFLKDAYRNHAQHAHDDRLRSIFIPGRTKFL